ncbi:MAG: gluconokinase [Janthinobacterium lividum]
MNDPLQRPARRFVVMGVSGCGKSAIGKLLAKQLGVTYVEGDDAHPPANIAKMASGTALDDDDRRAWLLQLQGRLRHAHEQGESMVLSCSALKLSYRDLLREGDPALVFLHLDGSPALIAERMAARKHHFMPPSLLQSQFRDLQPLQQTELGSRFDIDRSETAIVADMLGWIASRFPVAR